jgi:transcriptional regulator with XRE-family HTH domain
MAFLGVNQPLGPLFGLCVRTLRQEQGWTQVEFSERCGFYQTYLSRIENGQANPTLNAMEVIATGFGLSFFELIERVRMVGITPADK